MKQEYTIYQPDNVDPFTDEFYTNPGYKDTMQGLILTFRL